MNLVVDRLRASNDALKDVDVAAGHAAGRQWAMLHASHDELLRLSERAKGTEDAWKVAVPVTVLNDVAPDVDEVDDFWAFVSGTDKDVSEEFARGFARGAMEAFAEVQS